MGFSSIFIYEQHIMVRPWIFLLKQTHKTRALKLVPRTKATKHCRCIRVLRKLRNLFRCWMHNKTRMAPSNKKTEATISSACREMYVLHAVCSSDEFCVQKTFSRYMPSGLPPVASLVEVKYEFISSLFSLNTITSLRIPNGWIVTAASASWVYYGARHFCRTGKD